MRRINYIVTWSERHAGVALPTTIAPALRAPLAALASSIAFVIVVWGIQHVRLDAADRDAGTLGRRLAAAERDVARVRAVERDVARLRALGDRVAMFRRSGALRAGEIAAIGNQLPADAWLTSLHADRNAVALEGGSVRLAAVGMTIAGLARLPAYAGARLISVHDDPATSGVTYAIALEPRR